jgi:di/tricarboxylate transporter
MGLDALLTGCLVVAMLVVLATGRYGAEIVMLGVLVIMLVTGILKPEEAVKGFSNTGVITVAFLYVVAAGLQETGAVTLLTSRLLRRPKSALEAQARIVAPVAALSAFMNNTPLVVFFMPVISELSKRTRIAASHLFMPLSFAAILGGVCTLIGTSTNLVVHSLMLEHNQSHPSSPIQPFGMWTLSWVGIPVALVGILYMLLFGRKLLPDHASHALPAAEARQYMTAMQVAADSPIVGKTIEEAGLRHLPGLFLSRIDRSSESIVAVGPEEVLRAGDVLVFVGLIDSVVDLQKIKGLVPFADETGANHYRPRMRLIEAVISPSSPLIGRSVRDAEIRSRYGAVIIAVHRHGQRIARKIGDIVLRPGDTLLLEVEHGFAKRHRHSTDFHLLSELPGAAAPRHERAGIALAILAALVVLLSLENLLPTMTVAMAAAGATIVFRCATVRQAYASVEWPVLIVIGASFGLARALEKTGLAEFVATTIITWAADYGPWALIAVVYLLTLLFTTFISNNAAAALMFPIALGVAERAGLNFLPFAVSVAIAASCEFNTPLGYQTNLMVMGPGGYRWTDYTRFGGPLTALAALTCILLAPLVYGPLRL